MVLFYLVAFLQTFVTITLCVIGYFLNIKTGYKTKDKKGTTVAFPVSKTNDKKQLVDVRTILSNYLEEDPKSLTNINASDFQFFYGNDAMGNSLELSIRRIKGHQSTVYLRLQLEDETFLIPEELMKGNTIPGFESNSLKFENIIPYSRWRVTFSGILKKIKGSETTYGFVKFSFLWIADSDPLLRKYNEDNSNVSYEQFGSLFGQIMVNNAASINTSDAPQIIELNLPGGRQREWNLMPSSSRSCNADKYKRLLFVSNNGYIFQVILNNDDGNSGSLRKPNGSIAAIDWISLSHSLSDSGSLPRATTLLFRAEMKIYTVIVYFKKSYKINSTQAVTTEICLNGERGVGVLIIPNENVIPIVQQHNVQLTYSKISAPKEMLTVAFDEEAASSLAVSGGKGASLALLNSILYEEDAECPRFQVPPGFIITAAAYDLQFENNDSLRAAFSLDDKRYLSNRDDKSIRDGYDRIRDMMRSCILKAEIEDAILRHLEALSDEFSDNRISYAVRSSAIEEDGMESSFAGQNDTFLGLRTTEEILNSVKLCWASLYSAQSVEYRKQNSQNVFTKMAVVVQAMVPSESSGVLFTKYPTNGDPTKLLITANFGLGETVVSGEVDPDTFTVERTYQDELKVLSKQLGSKKVALELAADTNAIQKVEQHKTSFCLDDVFILKLAKIGIYLENAYGSARDIEWAVYNNEIYLLQARPITSLNNFTEWELLHEFDTAVMSPFELRTKANVGEVVAGAVTPLTQSVVIKSFDRIFADEVLQESHEGLFNNILGLSHNHADLNVYKVFLSANEEKLNLATKIYSLGVFGHEVITPEMHARGVYRYGVMSGMKKLKLIWSMITAIWNGKSKAEEVRKLLRQHSLKFSKLELIKHRSSVDLVKSIEESFSTLYTANKCHSQSSKASLFSQIITLTIMTEGSSDMTLDHGDLTLILESCNDAESAEIPKMLKQIAGKIHSAGLAEAFREIAAKDGVNWLRNNCAEAYDILKKFIQNHGHRSLKEFELATETWGMAPHLIVTMIQNNLNNVTHLNKDSRKKMLNDDEIIHNLRTPKSEITRMILKKFLPLCRKTVQRREQSKSLFISCIHDFKVAFRYLGKLMKMEGHLPAADLVFFLTFGEIKNILSGKDTHSLKKAIRRQKLYPKWNELRFPEIIFGLPKPIDPNAFSWDGKSTKKIMGTSVQSGIVRGRACVLKSFAEVDKIQFGDILITHCTDIGWSPYFPMLGGLVTELGGLISHGAVVAREYGLPCVVGAENATDYFQFGEEIVLNADSGVITKLEAE